MVGLRVITPKIGGMGVADGVLQDQHIGGASIEGKLKKLIAQASEMQATKVVASK